MRAVHRLGLGWALREGLKRSTVRHKRAIGLRRYGDSPQVVSSLHNMSTWNRIMFTHFAMISPILPFIYFSSLSYNLPSIDKQLYWLWQLGGVFLWLIGGNIGCFGSIAPGYIGYLAFLDSHRRIRWLTVDFAVWSNQAMVSDTH